MNYLSMTKAEIANGKGVRVALWVSGCNHRCINCQNPESWNANNGKQFTKNDLDKLLKELSLPYYDGLTFTGGDPLYPLNVNDIELIATKVKEVLPNKTIWCYTGFDFEDVKSLSVMNYIDVLVDGLYIDELKDITLPFKGSSNQRVIDVKKSLETNKVILYELN